MQIFLSCQSNLISCRKSLMCSVKTLVSDKCFTELGSTLFSRLTIGCGQRR